MSRSVGRGAWLAGLLLLAGCSHLTVGQQAHLDDWQRFASRVTEHYGVSEVTFLVGAQEGPGGGAMRPGGLMTFKVDMLEPLPAGQSRDFLLAHELAHWVLGHAYRRAPDEATTSVWDAQQEAGAPLRILPRTAVPGWRWAQWAHCARLSERQLLALR